MASFDEQFRRATEPGPDRKIPGAVLVAADRSGQIRYLNAQGFTSVDESLAEPLTADSVFWIASCTKLMTTIAALQCVEKDLLSLDEDVWSVLPELGSPDILTGFSSETGEPNLHKATQKITLRQLLTHSSGMGYDFLSPTLRAWREWTKTDLESVKGEITKQYSMPLLYEPGEKWEYSCSLDWAGLMVERVNGGVHLGEYMRHYIWEPLGMKSTTFRLNGNESVRRRLCSMTARFPSGDLIPSSAYRTSDSKDDLGGGGICCSPHDYIKVLAAILKNDGRLLKPSTIESMFQPQLSDDTYIKAAVSGDAGAMYRAGVVNDAWNFGLGGILNMEDVEGVCRKGTMSWGGLPNLYWWIDPTAGNCGMYATQVVPPADTISMDFSVAFRQDVQKKLATT